MLLVRFYIHHLINKYLTETENAKTHWDLSSVCVMMAFPSRANLVTAARMTTNALWICIIVTRKPSARTPTVHTNAFARKDTLATVLIAWTLMSVWSTTAIAIKTLDALTWQEVFSVCATTALREMARLVRILTNAQKTQRCVRTGLASILKGHSHATANKDSCILGTTSTNQVATKLASTLMSAH